MTSERPPSTGPPAGPVPQGSPPTETPPEGGDPSAGPSLTGHPPAAGDEPVPHLREEHEEQPDAIAEIEGELSSLLDAERERDGYLDDLRRLQAEFENFRKRSVRQQGELVDRAAETLVRELLAVLDVADLARAHGADDQVGAALFDVLKKEGLERLDPVGQPFDPMEHDAVMHEQGEGSEGEAVVSDVMRAGYRWRDRLLRPAMVKVTGG